MIFCKNRRGEILIIFESFIYPLRSVEIWSFEIEYFNAINRNRVSHTVLKRVKKEEISVFHFLECTSGRQFSVM